MNKLLPYWGHSPQPGHTYYQQKVSYDVFGIVDHQKGVGLVYTLSELVSPKNTDSTVSYLLHYLKSTGQVPEWIKRVQKKKNQKVDTTRCTVSVLFAA